MVLLTEIPRLFGYEVYGIVSGSMAPALPKGSLVLVKPVSWKSIAEKDIIAFQHNGVVVTHRVEEIRVEEQSFITKGDANPDADITPTPFDTLIGRVEKYIPWWTGTGFLIYPSGKIWILAALLGGLLLHVTGSLLQKPSEREENV